MAKNRIIPIAKGTFNIDTMKIVAGSDNLLWKFTSDNSYIKNEQGQRVKSVYKSPMIEEQKQYLLK